jgi:hypothetical protein
MGILMGVVSLFNLGRDEGYSAPDSIETWGARRTAGQLPISLSGGLRGGLPNCVQSPIDVLWHSTTDGAHPSNAHAQRSIPDAVRRLRDCARLCCESLGPVWPLPFRLHAGTCLSHRRALEALP